MRIVKFIIENYKSLKGKTEFNPEGSSFVLVGPNGAGKTSAGRAIIDMLTNSLPSVPITTGEESGFVEYTFSDNTKLKAKFNEKGNSIELISPEGLKIASPKDVLKKLAGDAMSFNIDDFISMQPKPRREMLEKMVGIDFTETNKEEAKLEEERRLKNAAYKAAAARCKSFDESLVDLEIIDTDTALNKLKAANENKTAHAKVLQGIKERKNRLLTIEAEIEKLTKEIATIDKELKAGEEWCATTDTISDEEIIRMEKLISQTDKIREAKRLKNEADEANILKEEAELLDTQIKELRNWKSTEIKNAKLPAGLRFDENGDITIDGIPFTDSQISASRKLIAGIQIATAMLGEIRYLHFDGAALDKKNTEVILNWANENDLQLCIERPEWEGGENVKMEIFDNTKSPVKEKKVAKVEQQEAPALPW